MSKSDKYARVKKLAETLKQDMIYLLTGWESGIYTVVATGERLTQAEADKLCELREVTIVSLEWSDKEPPKASLQDIFSEYE